MYNCSLFSEGVWRKWPLEVPSNTGKFQKDEFHPSPSLCKGVEWGFRDGAGVASKDSHLSVKLTIFCHVCFKHAVRHHGVTEADKKFGPRAANAARLGTGRDLWSICLEFQSLNSCWLPNVHLKHYLETYPDDMMFPVLFSLEKKKKGVNSLWDEQGKLPV